MGSSDYDYSIAEATARWEKSQSVSAVLAEDFTMLRPVLDECREIWSDAVATHSDPVGALRSEVADDDPIVGDPIGELLCQLADSDDILTPLLRKVSHSRNPRKAHCGRACTCGSASRHD